LSAFLKCADFDYRSKEMSEVYNILQPEYYSKFKCNTEKCLESCCERWKITIDKKTYLKYMESENKLIKEIIKDGLLVNDNSNNEDDYGIMNLRSDMTCPFLNDEKYCEVFINLGEDYLSKTCKSYPRAVVMIGDEMERALQMSCSVAAEQALLNKDGMDFENINEFVDFDYISINVIDINKMTDIDEFKKHRKSIIEMLKDRDFNLNDRLYNTGVYLHKVIKGDNYINHDFSPDYTEQFNILNNLLAMKFSEKDGIAFSSARYLDCLWKVLDVFGDIEEKKIGRYYRDGYERYLEPYLEKREYILENYLVNHVFIYGSEILNTEKIWDFYMKLCIVYGLMKFNLIGLAISNKGMDDEVALKLIQSLTKTIITDPKYLELAVQEIKLKGMTDLSSLRILTV
jgi:lysine-N-methylase